MALQAVQTVAEEQAVHPGRVVKQDIQLPEPSLYVPVPQPHVLPIMTAGNVHAMQSVLEEH